MQNIIGFRFGRHTATEKPKRITGIKPIPKFEEPQTKREINFHSFRIPIVYVIRRTQKVETIKDDVTKKTRKYVTSQVKSVKSQF